jgi:hypothetical protein
LVGFAFGESLVAKRIFSKRFNNIQLEFTFQKIINSFVKC